MANSKKVKSPYEHPAIGGSRRIVMGRHPSRRISDRMESGRSGQEAKRRRAGRIRKHGMDMDAWIKELERKAR